jgi:hypothetical protein
MALENKLPTKTQGLLLIVVKGHVKYEKHPSEEKHAFGDK